MNARRAACVLIAALLLLARPLMAHPAVSAVAVVKVEPGGRVTVTLTHDALAFALNEQPLKIADAPMLALLSGPREDVGAAFADAKERMQSGLRVTVDGAAVPLSLVAWPQAEVALQWKAGHPSNPLGVKQDFVAVGAIPAGARGMSIQFPAALGDVVLLLDRPEVEPLTLPLAAGEATGSLPPFPEGAQADRPGFLAVAGRFIAKGFTHIIPAGPDHALFVLGLFLLSPHPRKILWPITTFTLAHTTTVFLTAFQLVRSPPTNIVEPAIAATIAFVAIENLVSRRVHPWRPALAFAFGLVHGMGFAGDLSKVAMPTNQLVTAVLAFNVGVEGGHLAILGAAFVILGWSANRPWYRRRVMTPLSLAIAAVALFWFVQRIVGT